jgi:hypothetical protein
VIVYLVRKKAKSEKKEVKSEMVVSDWNNSESICEDRICLCL